MKITKQIVEVTSFTDKNTTKSVKNNNFSTSTNYYTKSRNKWFVLMKSTEQFDKLLFNVITNLNRNNIDNKQAVFH